MTNRFRELERPQTGRLKDVVLMATVTGFESLRIPSKSDMKQFAELFEPLFLGSSNGARRQAAAALSQCAHVPEPVARLIGSMPISIAAIFLTRSNAITDETLIAVIRHQGAAHASAIARRENLSPAIVDALVEHHQPTNLAVRPAEDTGQRPATASHPSMRSDADASSDRLVREDRLREEIKTLARADTRETDDVSAIQPIDELHQALLVRFARNGETVLFAKALADALGSSRALAERILLDISGQQLGVTLSALDVPTGATVFLLETLYPHLSERLGRGNRVEALMRTVGRKASLERVGAWLRADGHGIASPLRHEAYLAENRSSDGRQQEARPAAAQRGTALQQRAFGRR